MADYKSDIYLQIGSQIAGASADEGGYVWDRPAPICPVCDDGQPVDGVFDTDYHEHTTYECYGCGTVFHEVRP